MNSSNSYREKFKQNFVKPLYRPKCKEVKPNNKGAVTTHSVIELDGSDIRVNRKVVSDKNSHIDILSNKNRKDISIPKKLLVNNYIKQNSKHVTKNTLLTVKKIIPLNDCRMLNNMPQTATVKVNSDLMDFNTVPHVWLRIYPLTKQSRESFYSLIFRCVFCILGLYTLLIIWTVIWVFIIHSFEGPYEAQMSRDFEENQNQLVIDLATELRLAIFWVFFFQVTFVISCLHYVRFQGNRQENGEESEQSEYVNATYLNTCCCCYQLLHSHILELVYIFEQITPLSPKWKDAITKRIEDERQLTIVAVAKGAKLHPGEFWDLSGTFLFTIYVMTALGFGAPVPHTLWGRTSALLYALLAVPIHFYLMLNISECVIAHVDACTNNLKNKLSERKPFAVRKSTLEMISQNPNYSRDSEILQTKYSSCFRKMITRILNTLCACHCMPLIKVLYYVCGALAFGWSRNKQPLEVAMFPLEFTTTGGLEVVAGYVRILYAIYLEGAIILLACFISTMKRNCSSAVSNMADKHRLFTSIHVK